MRTLLKRLLMAALAGVTIVAVAVSACIWLLARDKVVRLRAVAAEAPPVPPAVASAIVAAEDPLMLTRPRVSPRALLRGLLPPPRGTVSCGPSPLAYGLVRALTPQRRPLRWHLETGVATYVVAYVFTPEELLRIYAHELYLGTLDGRQILSVEAASAVYFGKEPHHLTTAEAATLAAMLRSPNVFSPVKHPERLIKRRNYVLTRMAHLKFIDERQCRSAMAEPIRTKS